MANEPVSINSERSLTPDQYRDLADVPPELEWLANITNAKTRRAYKVDVAEFITFTNLKDHGELRTVARAHVIAWRKDMEHRSLAPTSIRRKLSALSSLFDYLCERNAVHGNPVDGVKRPASNNNEGSTPALGDAQVRRLLEAPPLDTLKGVRDRAILATPALSRYLHSLIVTPIPILSAKKRERAQEMKMRSVACRHRPASYLQQVMPHCQKMLLWSQQESV